MHLLVDIFVLCKVYEIFYRIYVVMTVRDIFKDFSSLRWELDSLLLKVIVYLYKFPS